MITTDTIDNSTGARLPKLKLLFVCTINRMRSATAYNIFKEDKRFEVRSAGTDKTANTVLSQKY